MKHLLLVSGAALLITSLVLLAAPASTGRALPEYAAQTGEPCSSCHVGPSGGGPRGPRGQAWVASAKPSVVPDLVQALELLGVELTVDESYYTVVELPPAQPQPLGVSAVGSGVLSRWLSDYEGN
jgi:hypothetical protein